MSIIAGYWNSKRFNINQSIIQDILICYIFCVELPGICKPELVPQAYKTCTCANRSRQYQVNQSYRTI
jgi:hypothetical protein